MGKFGDTLKRAVEISGMKYSTIARRINFDPSYISKWINSDLLPSHKASSFICAKLSEIILEDIKDEDLIRLCEQLDIKCTEDQDITQESIYKKLYSNYLTDYNLQNQKDNPIIEDNYEMKTYSTAKEMSDSQNIILRKISEYRQTSDLIEIYIISDILSCSTEDIIFLMDIKAMVDNLKFKDVIFNVFISESNISNFRNSKTAIAFLNLLMLQFDGNIYYYSTKIMQSGLIISVSNLLLYSSQLSYNDIWRLSNLTYDINKINHFNKTIKDNILPVGLKLFEIYDSTCPDNIYYMQYILSNHEDSVLIGTLDSFFLNTDLLKKLLDLTNDIPCDIKDFWIKKHLINEKRISKGEEFRYIIFREAFKKFVKKGRIRLIGQDISLPIKLRLEVLESLENKLLKFQNIQVKIIDSYIVNEIKHKDLPNLYLSANSGFFLMFPVNGNSKFSHIKYEAYSYSLQNTFNSIWNEKTIPLSSSAEVVSKYLDISKRMFLFE